MAAPLSVMMNCRWTVADDRPVTLGSSVCLRCRLLGRRPPDRMSAGSPGELSGFLDVKVPARVRRRRGLAPWKVSNVPHIT
jgi:hypothetical protein